MKLFHIVRGYNRCPTNARGIIFRTFGARVFGLILSVPLPGRYTVLSDYSRNVIRNAKLDGYICLDFAFNKWWHKLTRIHFGTTVFDEQTHDTGRTARILVVERTK